MRTRFGLVAESRGDRPHLKVDDAPVRLADRLRKERSFTKNKLAVGKKADTDQIESQGATEERG